MRSLTGGSAGLPDAFGQTGSRFGKSCSVPGEPLLAYLSGGLCPRKQLRPSSDVKITTKGWKTLATTHVDKVQWHGWAQQPVRQKSSKNARVYKFLLRADKWFPSIRLPTDFRCWCTASHFQVVIPDGTQTRRQSTPSNQRVGNQYAKSMAQVL